MAEAQPRVIFRADASRLIGGGHIVRCMSLAATLRDRGIDVAFATCAESLATVPALGAAGYAIIDVAPGERLIDTVRRGGEGNGLIVDHYFIDTAELTECRAATRWIGVLDDIAEAPYDADLIINQTELGAGPYDGLIPRHATVLDGPRYALLRPEFAALRATSHKARRDRRTLTRLFGSFGLTDTEGWALWLATTLGGTRYAVDIAIGSAAASLTELRAVAARHGNVMLHVDSTDVARIMSEADVAIGAGGSTSWERCCLGLPSIIVIAADNQRKVARSLVESGAVEMIDHETRDQLPAMLDALAVEPQRLDAMAAAAFATCDGEGAQRVAVHIAGLTAGATAGSPTLRRADSRDRADFWFLRNEPAGVAVSGDGKPVPWADHKGWWARALADPRCLLLAAELGGRTVGYVRFARDEAGVHEVSIALSPAVRGRGLSADILNRGLDALFASEPAATVRALVDRGNTASQRLFARCGFAERGSEGRFIVWERDRAGATAKAGDAA